ncbi:MAG TPA: bifunctional pyr operon transcriptional regulator/uracil phosphoribosyltransferase PyrR [Flavobacteriales bacterium]|nr:bifunctional pyr operon transcriptional regulator/uracil phosphoribosyltransferase PyrR [Flavobacteriales bacterium]
MHAATLLDSTAFGLTVQRLCYQLVEDHDDLSNTVLLGLQPRGVFLSRRLVRELGRILGGARIGSGELDITFHRDDFRRRPMPLAPNAMQMDLSIEGRHVVLIDDVLYTGRSIRAGLDALLSFGRPASVQLLVLIDRRFARELPIAADYVGRWVDSIEGQRVTVEWAETEGEDRVLLHGGDGGTARGIHHQASSTT